MKKQINPPINVYRIRGAVYPLGVAVICVIQFALAPRAATATLTSTVAASRSSCCEGGGGATPVVHAAQLYVRESYCTPQTNGLVLNPNTGALIRGFNSDTAPAFL
jgi:hypothetical protein